MLSSSLLQGPSEGPALEHRDLGAHHVDLDLRIRSPGTQQPSVPAHSKHSQHALLQYLATVLDTMDQQSREPADAVKGTAIILGVEHLRSSMTTLQMITMNDALSLLTSDAEVIWTCSCKWVTACTASKPFYKGVWINPRPCRPKCLVMQMSCTSKSALHLLKGKGQGTPGSDIWDACPLSSNPAVKYTTKTFDGSSMISCILKICRDVE